MTPIQASILSNCRIESKNRFVSANRIEFFSPESECSTTYNEKYICVFTRRQTADDECFHNANG